MFRHALFRDRALVRNAQPEPLDDLLRVTAPHEWLLLAGLAGVVLAIVVWSLVARIERTVSAHGVIVWPGERHTVVSMVAGVVTKTMVEPGDRVEAGQAIARVQVPELDWRLRIARMRAAMLEQGEGSSAARESGWRDAELRAARAEVLELAALQAAGEFIVSSRDGEVTLRNLAAGQVVRPGDPVAEIRADTRGTPQVSLIVGREEGRRIELGMPARVVVEYHAGSRTFAADVVDVSPRPAKLPPWLSRFGLDVSREDSEHGELGRLVRLAMVVAEDVRIPDGTPCRVAVVLAQESPFGLLTSAIGHPE